MTFYLWKNELPKINKQNLQIVGVLKVTDENGRICSQIRIPRGTDPRIRIRTKMSQIRNTGAKLKRKIVHDYIKRSPTYKLCGIDKLWHICPESEYILASILPNFYTEWNTEQRKKVIDNKRPKDGNCTNINLK
jgi:hypothetical protein